MPFLFFGVCGFCGGLPLAEALNNNGRYQGRPVRAIANGVHGPVLYIFSYTKP